MSADLEQLSSSLTIPYALYLQSQRVGACAYLEDVRTHNIEADLKNFGLPRSMRPDLTVDIQITPPMESGAFIVAMQYDLTLINEDTADTQGEHATEAEHEVEGERDVEEAVVANISVGIAGLYSSHDLPNDIEEAELQAFGRSVAALALHAYARELISSTTQRFGLPQLVLPPMRIINDAPMTG